jgi:hypothetical protein
MAKMIPRMQKNRPQQRKSLLKGPLGKRILYLQISLMTRKSGREGTPLISLCLRPTEIETESKRGI